MGWYGNEPDEDLRSYDSYMRDEENAAMRASIVKACRMLEELQDALDGGDLWADSIDPQNIRLELIQHINQENE